MGYEFTNEIVIAGMKSDKHYQVTADGERYKLIKAYTTQLNQSHGQGYGGVITNNRFDKREEYSIYTVCLDTVPVKLKDKDILKAVSDDGAPKGYLSQ